MNKKVRLMVSTETVMLKQCSRGQEVLATSQKGHNISTFLRICLLTVFENQVSEIT